MTNIALLPPIVGEKNTTAEPKVGTAIKKVEEYINGKNIDGTSNLKTEGVLEANLEKPLQEKLAAVLTGVKIKTVTESTTAATGEMILAAKAGITITLPAATINREVVVFNTAGTCKVKTTAGFIQGDFIDPSQAEVELAKFQHITVQADGNNWEIKAGEPKRNQIYVNKAFTKVEAEAGVTPSASRQAHVSLSSSVAITGLTVGGVALIVNAATRNISFMVNPGQAWKATIAVETSTLSL